MALGKKVTSNWNEAYDAIKEQGYVNISTGGGSDWNQEVADKLSRNTGRKVLLIGESPDYTIGDGIFRFASEAKNNKQAAMLLDNKF